MKGRDAKIVVVGGGMGGLACAIDLAAVGHRVVLLERAATVGGKARDVMVGAKPIAAGPTVLTMPWVFDELFDAAGASFRSELPLERANILARHAWSDGTRVDLHADRQESADAIGEVFGPEDARNYLAFCEDGRRIFEIAEKPFFRGQKPTVGSILKQVGSVGIASFAKLDGHRTMWRALEQRFVSPRLRQLFGRYATYVGSSPFDAPATLNIIAHVEAEGVYRAKGGMRGLVVALARLATKLGVEICTGRNVERIVVTRRRAVGVISDDEILQADAVVFNGDASALGAGLLGDDATRAAPAISFDARSLSAVTWTMNARPAGFPLVHHNVFFSDDYAAEFDAMLRVRQAPAAPTVYICAQDRGDDGSAKAGPESERLLVLSNAPATGDEPERWRDSEKKRCTTATMDLLQKLGLTLESEATLQTTPVDFAQLYPGTGGALYGPRSKGALAAMSRPGAETKIARLYLTGGSVHPGAGVPMAALSGRLAAQKICADLASTG